MKTKIGLTIIFLFMVGFKIGTNIHNQKFNSKNDTVLFWTESALQYRTAKLIAMHGYAPSIDTTAQFPEGLDIKNRLTTLMEVVTGYTYRLFIPKNVPFHLFLIIFVALYSSLSLFPLSGIINVISEKKEAGLLGATFYALTPAVYTTVTAPGYEYQDFALPLIFFHVYLFVRAMRTSKHSSYSYAFLSATFLFAAFASWHLTQFYYILFVVFTIICFLFVKNFDMKPFYIITGVMIVAGMVLPTQSSAGFLVSLSMLLSYALVIASVIPKRHRMLRKLLFGGLFLIATFVTLYIAFINVPEYRFVYGLMWDKIKHFGIRPSDPTVFPWETLVMWVSPFTGPSLNTIARSIGSLLIVGMFGVIMSGRKLVRKEISITDGLFLFFLVVFFPLYLFLIRLDAFLVWFLSFQAGRLLSIKKKFSWPIIIVCLVINGFLLFTSPKKSVGPSQNYLLGIIKYIRYNTPKDVPILTNFAYGPTIIAYTERPILVHPKFEAEHITNKIKVFEHRIFQNETTFYAFCKSYKARYFIYQTDMLLACGPESMRYRTHNMIVSKNCAVFKFHFHPQALTFFELVYSNPHYRIYRILERGESVQHKITDYFRVYDETIFDLNNFGIIKK